MIADPVSGWAERMDEGRLFRVGLVGVGAIATAIVDALMSGPHADEIDIVLSPRSAPRSAELAARHRQVRVAPYNQSVVDAADIVILAVLPDQMAALCSSLSFREEQVVVSLAAGWPPSLLAEHVAPAATVCQMIPLPMIALHTGRDLPTSSPGRASPGGLRRNRDPRAGSRPDRVELCIGDDVDVPRI
jgi:pyrroline-5-carboxylate reductase